MIPETGRQLWFLPGLVGGRTVTGPTPGEGMVYVTRGMRGPLLAVKLGGTGELPESDIVWKYDQGTPDTPCPVVSKRFVVHRDRRRDCPGVRRSHGGFALEAAADGRLQSLAFGRRRKNLLPEHGRTVHGHCGLGPFREAGRKSIARRDARLAGGFRRPVVHPRPPGPVLPGRRPFDKH